MASLTWKIPQIGSQRVGIFLSKCKKNIAHDTVDGGKAVITHIIVNGRETPIKSMSLASLTSALAGSYKFLDKNENVLGITNLQKTDDYKDDGRRNFNKGNVAEILFAGAIFCRFKSKSKRVTESEVHSLIRSLPRDKAMGSKAEMSANKNPDVRKDFVWLHWGLSQNNYDAVKDDTLWQAWSKYTAAAVTYANSTKVSEYADMFYSNNLHNRIQILADGESDQTGTKVDVRVIANDHEGKQVPLDLNISLKVGAVKQFGQYGGVSYDVQEKLWDEFFGIDLPFTEKKYLSHMGTENHEKDMRDALNFSYSEVAPHVAKSLSSPKIGNFFKAVNFHMTRNENPVFLIQLDNKGQAIEYDTNKLENKMKNITFSSKLGRSGDLPKMIICTIIDGREEVFLEIRVKRGEYSKDGTPYYRNIFEKGKSFTKLLSRIIA